ncbi:hypothetical protein LCGC14_0456590 [marine sediment metagenome]|uniref:Uncharacterized protein n=1 Tax=marine sediment metagenome TaxID=412755 RepID=A0A0F9SZ43_9ZZZZ|nr:hypothetical protein [Candidatus Aminicenantes bacterium]
MTSPDANFTPVRRLISTVTNADQAVVTTSADHGYVTDDWIRLIVPLSHGMEIDYEQSKITVLSTTQFRTTIDTSFRLPFVVPAAPFTPAHVVPIGGISVTDVTRSDGT